MRGVIYPAFFLLLAFALGEPDYADHSLSEIVSHYVRVCLLNGLMPVGRTVGAWHMPGPRVFRLY